MTVMLTLIVVVCTIISCIYASLSKKHNGKEGISQAYWFFSILFNGVFTFVSWEYFNNPWVYIVALAILSILSLLNREGIRRRLSWFFMIVAYSVLLVFSVAEYATTKGEWHIKLHLVCWWLVPIVVALVCNYGLNVFFQWLRAKGKRIKTTAKVASKKVINKLDSLAESDGSNPKTKPGYKVVKLSDIQ